MAAHITRNRTTPVISEQHEIQPHEDRRNETRVTPPWHVKIELGNGLRFSAALGDLSIRTFQIELPAVLHLGTEVQFSISENRNKYLGGKALKGEAIVSVIHAQGIVFEFQDFEGDDFDRYYEALLQYVEDPKHASE